MSFPSHLKYTKDHEWAKVEGKTVTVGITHHAQNALGDVVYVELPKAGKEVKKGDTFGVVESIKAVSDLYSPVTGKVIESHSKVVETPSTINQDPHGEAWLVKIEVTDPSSLSDLMDAQAYEKYVATL